MKVENGKIVAVIESELFDLYLRWEMDDIMDFNEYKTRMKSTGCVVVGEE